MHIEEIEDDHKVVEMIAPPGSPEAMNTPEQHLAVETQKA
jgi:hypothetical protein